MWGWFTIRTPRQRLINAGINPDTAWSDDPGLKRWQRSCLRSIGRHKNDRIRQEQIAAGTYGSTRQGMGADGKQRRS